MEITGGVNGFFFAMLGIFCLQCGNADAGEAFEVSEGRWDSHVVAVHESDWEKSVNVTSVHVDHDGFVWSGSSDGLRYFAGGSAVVVPLCQQNGLSEPCDIRDLDQRKARGDRIWYLLPEGVGWVDKVKAEYKYFPHEIEDVSFRKFCFDDAGTCWIAASTGLFQMNPKSGEFEKKFETKAGDNFIDLQPDCLSADILWLVTGSDGLLKYDASTGGMVTYNHRRDGQKSINVGRGVTSMCQMPNGEIFMGGRNLLSRLDAESGEITTMMLRAERSLKYRVITSLFTDVNGGGIWLGTASGRGILHFDHNTSQFTSYGESIRLSSTRLGLNCNDLAIDHGGVLWIATKEDGLVQSPVPIVPSKRFSFEAKTGDSVYRGDVKFFSRHGNYLIAQTSQGVMRIDLKKGRLERITGKTRFNDEVILASMQMPDGTYLAGFEKKIHRFQESAAGEPEWIEHIDLPPIESTDWMDFAPELDASGKFWFTRRDKLYRYDFEAGQLKEVAKLAHWSDCVRLVGDKLWVATKGHLYSVDVDNLEVNLIPLNRNVAVSDIFKIDAKSDELLLATSEGLFSANPVENSLRRVDVDVINVRSICEADNGKLWLAVDGKLKLYDHSREELVSYSAETEVNVGSSSIRKVYRIDDERLAVGSWGNIQIFSESNLLAQTPARSVPLVMLEHSFLGIDNQPSGTPFGTTEVETLSVTAEAFGTRFKFGMPDYRYPEMVKIEYQLDDGNWRPAENGEFEITNLKPGEHTVRVRAEGSTGQKAENEVVMSLRVIPPIVESPMFYACVTLGLCGLLLLIYRIRTQYVIKTQKQLKSVNALLKSSESRYRKIFENSSDAIVMTTAEGVVTASNSSARTMLGYADETPLADFENLSHHLEDGFPVDKILANIRSGEDLFEEAIEVKKSDSTTTQTLATVTLVEGESEEWQFQFHDVSRKVALEEQIRQAQKMEAVATLAGGIAHDFNNLLSPIIVHSALAREEISREPASAEKVAQSALNICEEAATKAAGLVKNLLHFARKADDGNAPVELGAATRSAIKLLEGSAPSNVKIVTNFPEKSAWICCSEQRLEQALMNIGVNASHAIGIEAGELRISLVEKIDQGNDTWEIRIEDTGCGMDKKTLQRVFEPFYTTKSVGEGTGLGLSMVHTFVEDSGGTVSIDSTPGEGTVIRMVFSKINHRAEKIELSQEPKASLQSSDRGHDGGHILVVDDDRLVLLATTKILEKQNFKVSQFEESVKALEEFQKHPDQYSAIVTDQMMPMMTGLDLAGEIRKTAKTIPIILLTGFSGLHLDEVEGGDDITEVLIKPLDYDVLNQTLRRNIDSDSEPLSLALAS